MQHHLSWKLYSQVVFMAFGKRTRLSAIQRADVWRRWKAGESLHEIGRDVGKDHVEDRAIPGHWEGDLLAGARNSHVATMVERHSRFVLLVKVPSKDTASAVAALSQHVRTLPATLRRIVPSPEKRDYRNVWSAAEMQAKNAGWQLVGANVFGL
jgi:hypothetical protein